MTVETTDAAPARRTPTWVVATIAGVFGLFYAYAVWNALAFLITFGGGGVLNPWGWFVLLFAVVFPAIAFAAAFAVGYKLPAAQFALVLLAGLGVTAVFWLNVIAYILRFSGSIIG